MARPPKPPDQRRTEYLHLRLSPTEMHALRKGAAEYGLTPADFARSRIMGTPLRRKPLRDRLLSDLHYELNSIATNLSQLEAAVGDPNYGGWARFVGKDLPERLVDRTDLSDVIEPMLEKLNGIGVAINGMARRGNQGKPPSDDEANEKLNALKEVLEPLRQAVKKPPRKRPEPDRDDIDRDDDERGGRDAL